MAKQKKSGDASLVQARHVFDAAARTYARLMKKRERLVAELAEVDRVLARLPNAAPMDEHGRTGPTIRELVVQILRERQPQSRAELFTAIARVRPATSKGTLDVILKQMRTHGEISASGPPREFAYSLHK